MVSLVICCLTSHLYLSRLIIISDIAFYGVNLNQSVILTKIGYGTGATPWQTLFNIAVGNIIVSACVRAPNCLKVSLNIY